MLLGIVGRRGAGLHRQCLALEILGTFDRAVDGNHQQEAAVVVAVREVDDLLALVLDGDAGQRDVDMLGLQGGNDAVEVHRLQRVGDADRSEEHTSELQSLMRISYDVFCLKKKNTTNSSN